MKTKLASRKLWESISGTAVGLAVVIAGGLNSESEPVQIVSIICGTILVAVSIVIYVAVEGKIDATRKE